MRKCEESSSANTESATRAPNEAQSAARALNGADCDIASIDPIWHAIRREAEESIEREPELASLFFEGILNYRSLERALGYRVAQRLGGPTLSGDGIQQAFQAAFRDDSALSGKLRADLAAVYDRDPACERYLEPLLYFKGFHAIQAHRLAHWLWRAGRKDFALHLQSRSSEVFQVDIHPQVPLGKGLFIDHATSIVIGSTAVVGDDVSILQGVTLGGTGKESGDRHPKIGCGVLVGAGAKVLGNFVIGDCSRIAAGSVVLSAVPAKKTVAGVPAKIVGDAGCSQPGRSMHHILPYGDPVLE